MATRAVDDRVEKIDNNSLKRGDTPDAKVDLADPSASRLCATITKNVHNPEAAQLPVFSVDVPVDQDGAEPDIKLPKSRRVSDERQDENATADLVLVDAPTADCSADGPSAPTGKKKEGEAEAESETEDGDVEDPGAKTAHSKLPRENVYGEVACELDPDKQIKDGESPTVDELLNKLGAKEGKGVDDEQVEGDGCGDEERPGDGGDRQDGEQPDGEQPDGEQPDGEQPDDNPVGGRQQAGDGEQQEGDDGVCVDGDTEHGAIPDAVPSILPGADDADSELGVEPGDIADLEWELELAEESPVAVLGEDAALGTDASPFNTVELESTPFITPDDTTFEYADPTALSYHETQIADANYSLDSETAVPFGTGSTDSIDGLYPADEAFLPDPFSTTDLTTVAYGAPEIDPFASVVDPYEVNSGLSADVDPNIVPDVVSEVVPEAVPEAVAEVVSGVVPDVAYGDTVSGGDAEASPLPGDAVEPVDEQGRLDAAALVLAEDRLVEADLALAAEELRVAQAALKLEEQQRQEQKEAEYQKWLDEQVRVDDPIYVGSAFPNLTFYEDDSAGEVKMPVPEINLAYSQASAIQAAMAHGLAVDPNYLPSGTTTTTTVTTPQQTGDSGGAFGSAFNLIDPDSVLPSFEIGDFDKNHPPQTRAQAVERFDSFLTTVNTLISDSTKHVNTVVPNVLSNADQRITHKVETGQTLEEIALKHFGDERYAELIYRMNMKEIPTKYVGARKLRLNLLPEMQLTLPTPQEFNAFIQSNSPARRKNFEYERRR